MTIPLTDATTYSTSTRERRRMPYLRDGPAAWLMVRRHAVRVLINGAIYKSPSTVRDVLSSAHFHWGPHGGHSVRFFVASASDYAARLMDDGRREKRIGSCRMRGHRNSAAMYSQLGAARPFAASFGTPAGDRPRGAGTGRRERMGRSSTQALPAPLHCFFLFSFRPRRDRCAFN